MRPFTGKSGFTLVELVVGVTISILLMSSVMFFVTSGMRNISMQQTILSNTRDESVFFERLFSLFTSAQSEYFTLYASGALLKIDSDYSDGGFLYIGEKLRDDYYCFSGSLVTETPHLQYFSFIPFEGEGGDIFNSLSTLSGSVTTNFFSGTLDVAGTVLTGSILGPTGIALNGNILYIADTLGHKIVSVDTTSLTSPPITLVGQGVAGSVFDEGDDGTDALLNNPTGLAYAEGTLFISDTLNNRVLSYDTVSGTLSTLLSKKSGLDEPNGLYYDSLENALYIANSGKGEILKFSSSIYASNPPLTLDLSPGTNIPGVDNFSIDFFTSTGSVSGNFSFTGFTAGGVGYSTGSQDRMDYYFTDFATLEYDSGATGIASCSDSTDYYLENGVIKRQIVSCSSAFTGSIQIYRGAMDTNMIAGNSYMIGLSSIVGDFLSNAKAYYVKLTLFSADSKLWEKYFPYFTQGDGLVTTKDDNSLEVFATGLEYPTGVYGVGVNIAVNEFMTRKQLIFDNGGNQIGSSDLTDFDFKKIDDFSLNTLSTPLKSLEFNRTLDLFTMVVNYYKSYDCEGEDSLNIERKTIFKKHLQ